MVLNIFILSEARDYLDNLFYFYFFLSFPSKMLPRVTLACQAAHSEHLKTPT